MNAISHFTNIEKIFSLASGAPVPAYVEVRVPPADTAGKTLKEDFIHNRFGYASTKCSFNTLK